MRAALAMCLVLAALPAAAACKGRSESVCDYLTRSTERELAEFDAWTRERDTRAELRKLTDEVRRLREEQESAEVFRRRY